MNLQDFIQRKAKPAKAVEKPKEAEPQDPEAVEEGEESDIKPCWSADCGVFSLLADPSPAKKTKTPTTPRIADKKEGEGSQEGEGESETDKGEPRSDTKKFNRNTRYLRKMRKRGKEGEGNPKPEEKPNLFLRTPRNTLFLRKRDRETKEKAERERQQGKSPGKGKGKGKSAAKKDANTKTDAGPKKPDDKEETKEVVTNSIEKSMDKRGTVEDTVPVEETKETERNGKRKEFVNSGLSACYSAAQILSDCVIQDLLDLHNFIVET